MECNICGRELSGKLSLRKHMARVHFDKCNPITCDLCGKEIDNKPGALKLHKDKFHNEKFKCNVCQMTFAEKKYLDNHHKVHEEPQFECKYCGKKMKHKYTLVQHERIHTGEKPIQ